MRAQVGNPSTERSREAAQTMYCAQAGSLETHPLREIKAGQEEAGSETGEAHRDGQRILIL
jgi:hypothetical protein